MSRKQAVLEQDPMEGQLPTLSKHKTKTETFVYSKDYEIRNILDIKVSTKNYVSYVGYD